MISNNKRIHSKPGNSRRHLLFSPIAVLAAVFLLSFGDMTAAAQDNLSESEYERLTETVQAGTASVSEVLQFIAVSPDVSDNEDALIRYAENADPVEGSKIYRELGLRAYLLGEIPAAAEYLSMASDETRIDPDSLLLSAHANFLLGRHDSAQNQIQRILRHSDSDAIRQQALTVLGLSRISAEEELAAISIFEPFRSNPEQIVVPELLYVLIRYELTLDPQVRRDPGSYYHILRRRFSSHPVTQLARSFLESGGGADGDIVHIPTPEVFLFSNLIEETTNPDLPDADSETSSSSGDETPQVPNIPRGIQVGSFGLLENAEYLQQDLQSAGFPVEIEQQQRGDRLYYSVIVPLTEEYTDTLMENLNTVEPEQIYLQIKSQGYDGFRIYEE